jgi:hypothetical protein|tara:strand:+ start:339 stop:584 length:246 start_codon:yes stop_codon:yes gene_type:complete
MSSEVHRHIEERLVKSKTLLNTKVVDFPKNKNLNRSSNSKIINDNLWNINDKSNDDQLKAVVGVCFIFGALVLMGLYSNLM